MSHTYGRAIFTQLLFDIRSDLEYIKKLFRILDSKINESSPIDEETKTWIMDVFIDKIYEVTMKVNKISMDISNKPASNTKGPSADLVSRLHHFAFPEHSQNVVGQSWDSLIIIEINKFIKWVEWDASKLREYLVKNDWAKMDSIKPVSYVTLERKKYVTAREELNKARKNIDSNPEDVMNYIRTSIDLAIREKFGFRKIPKMIKFIEQANKLDFPLPSYDLIYTYFNEGSQRLHDGKIHTKFEGQEIVKTVSNFIDELELIDVEKEQIETFVSKCNCAEL